MREMMQCYVVEAPGRLALREVPIPVPGRYEALCRLKWAGTCTATDQHIIEGHMPFTVPYPCILGHESVGEVVELGPGVTTYRAGDHVSRVGAPAGLAEGLNIAWGGYSQWGIAVDHWAMARDGIDPGRYRAALVNQIIPGDIPLKECAMLTTWRETLSFIRRMGVGPGSRVLVVGSGGNGLSFVRHAVNLGAGWVAVAGSASRLHIAQALGAALAVDYRDANAADRLREALPGSFDFILDAVGADGAMDPYLGLLAPGRYGGSLRDRSHGAVPDEAIGCAGKLFFLSGGLSGG